MGKNINLCLLLLLISTLGFGQNKYYHFVENQFTETDKSKTFKKLLQENKIKELQSFYVKKGRKSCIKRLTSESLYSNSGDLLDYKFFSKSGNLKRNYQYIRDSNGNILEEKIFKGNQRKLMSKNVYTYNLKCKVTTELYYFKDRLKPTYATYYQYDNNYNLISQVSKFPESKKEDSRMEYTYYSNGDRKETTEFRNGKIKKIWKYDCSPTGTLVSKGKNTDNVCIRYETDKNGNKLIISEDFNPISKSRRIIKSSLAGNFVESFEVTKKGKYNYFLNWDYNSDNHLIEKTSFGSDGKSLLFKNQYEYDKNGNIIKSAFYDHSNKLVSEYAFQYLKRE